ncbi:MAG: DUF1415 domain-containing protein [Methylococcales bacterium]|jgi:uncharacterized protein|nr:DUF1415 domain-containing protein [Methylococcales bacterium]MBT7409442.1 DUF1415 domain-containing protein [Methylococcales bacterium]
MIDAVKATQQWLKTMVVGLNLCPFAAKPLAEQRVRFALCEANDDDTIYQTFLQEVEHLLKTPVGELETTLLIVSHALTDFDDYLDMLEVLDDALIKAELEGVLQLASFHPDYLFADAPDNDPANYSNRSPFPTFHLIREDSLQDALENYDQPELIPENNQKKLRALGILGIEALKNGTSTK